MMPKVSVVMPVYNGERFLAQAIESILAQTFTDFELIIVCEYGTNQASLDIISRYAERDGRIVVLHNEIRRALPVTLNIGMKAANGCYIARMDSDDIALPDRLAVQAGFMDENPDTAICCSRVIYIDESGRELYYKDNLSHSPEQIKSDLFFFCFIHHPSVVFRKSDVIEHGLYYDEAFTAAEDHELWCRAAGTVKIAKTPGTLLKYRWHQSSASHTGDDRAGRFCPEIVKRNLHALGIEVPHEELLYLCRITCRESFRTGKNVERTLDALYGLIIAKNRELKLYDESCLVKTLDRRMYWRQHKVRRFAAVLLKSAAGALSKGSLFYLALYLELNGFGVVTKRLLRRVLP